MAPRTATIVPFVLLIYSALPGCTTQASTPEMAACAGTTDLPADIAWAFYETTDDSLLGRALGEAEQGGLCQGRVYVSTVPTTVHVYRAWNSTNPNSRMGKWWAFSLPDGKVAQYRSDYEICYQFSPLDKLTECTLSADAKLVVGTGQSMKCSDYLTYPVSEAKQVYMEIDPQSPALTDCKDYDGMFSWRPASAQ